MGGRSQLGALSRSHWAVPGACFPALTPRPTGAADKRPLVSRPRDTACDLVIRASQGQFLPRLYALSRLRARSGALLCSL